MEVKPELVSFEIEDANLTEAAKILGTKTVAETVIAALREIVAMRRRLEAFDGLAKMAVEGDFDVLLDKENYRR